MPTPAVQAASCAAAATAVITTTVIVVPTANIPVFFKDTTSFNSVTSKLVNDFYSFFLDTSKNQDYWEFLFGDLSKKTETNNWFSGVSKAFDANLKSTDANSKALNQGCHFLIQNKTTTEVKVSHDSSENSKNSQIWKFCSTLRETVYTVKDNNEGGTNSSALIKTKESELVSLTKNDKFWELKNNWFSRQTITDAFFSQFGPTKEEGKQTLKDACKAAYSQTAASGSSSTTAPTADAASKFCGFKIQTVS